MVIYAHNFLLFCELLIPWKTIINLRKFMFIIRENSILKVEGIMGRSINFINKSLIWVQLFLRLEPEYYYCDKIRTHRNIRA